MSDTESGVNGVPTHSDSRDDKIDKLTALVQKLADEKDAAEKVFDSTSKQWENRLKQLELSMNATQLTSQVNQNNMTGISIPISPDQTTQGFINVQVDHVVRGDHGASFHYRVKPFSGHSPKGGEVTFEEWLKQVELVVEDDSLSEKGKRQKILGSLHSPALDLARSLGSDVTAREICEHMEKMYGSTANGVQLLHEFFKMSREPTERATDYLQRLYIKICKVAKKGGIRQSHVDETLITHFKTTCKDEQVAQVLHIKFDTENLPNFELFMRTVKKVEEEFGDSSKKKDEKPKARLNMQQQSSEGENLADRLSKLEKQISEFTEQCTNVLQAVTVQNQQASAVQRGEGSNSHSTDGAARGGSRSTYGRNRRVYFCYNCGQDDGHSLRNCTNPTHAALVQRRLTERNPHQNGPSGVNDAGGAHNLNR